MKLDFSTLLDAELSNISLWARDLTIAEELRFYAEVLSSYMAGDMESLARTFSGIESLNTNPYYKSLKLLTSLRLQIRKSEISREALMDAANAMLPGVLNAEKSFILGLSFERLGEDAMAATQYQLAMAGFKTSCEKKSLRCFYNLIAAETRIYPYKNFVASLQGIIEVARKLQETSIEGTALSAISREYQVVGLSGEALEMGIRAVACLRKERGTFHYFHALLHLAHLYIERDDLALAKPLLQEAELASYKEIKAARELLLCAVESGRIWDRALEKSLMPTWKNRVPQLESKIQVASGAQPSKTATNLEDRLMKIAYNGPVEKWTLIEKIYVGETETLQMENRFKNLVARVRKKYPGFLHCKDGRYYLEKSPEGLSL